MKSAILACLVASPYFYMKKQIMKKKLIYYSKAVWNFAKRRWFLLVCLLFVALIVRYSITNQSQPKTIYSRVASQISKYDGSHKGLEAYIKAHMDDPDSYEHIKTTFKVPDDKNATTAIYTTTFRGKNAFGGIVINSISARCDLETGMVIEVISQ